MRAFLRSQSGSVLILMTFCFAVLAGFGVLTVDVCRILVTRTQLQNAADAAALAGAGLFCSSTPTEDEVRAQARLVGGANAALGDQSVGGRATSVVLPDSQISVNLLSGEVRVIANSETRQYFLALLGPRVVSQLVSANATAQCAALCAVSCLKPWSIPDRWDDTTPIAGYDSGPNAWVNNEEWDSEDFIDLDEDGMWDPGEAVDPRSDDNGNGQYDEEYYNPVTTGYNPDPTSPPNTQNGNLGDIGLQLTLKSGNPSGSDPPAPGQYFPVDFPPINKGRPVTGGDQYRENIAGCNTVNGVAIEPGDSLQLEPGAMIGPTAQGMRDLIAQDPGAAWDPNCQCVVNSAHGVSPRVVLLPLHNPRAGIISGRRIVVVTKVVAFFIENMQGQNVVGRFLKVQGEGVPCPPGVSGPGNFAFRLSLTE
jgi:hypothetical protein